MGYLHRLVPDVDPLVRGEEAEQTDTRGEDDTVAHESQLPGVDAIKLLLFPVAVVFDALEDVLGSHVGDLYDLDFLAELAASRDDSLELAIEHPELSFLLL